MISEQRKEATKLAAALINTIAAAYLLAGLVAPFLPGATGTTLTDIGLRVGAGFLVHMLAQGVLFFGLRDVAPDESESNEPNSSDVSDRLDLSVGDNSHPDGILGAGKTNKRESTKPEELEN